MEGELLNSDSAGKNGSSSGILCMLLISTQSILNTVGDFGTGVG